MLRMLRIEATIYMPMEKDETQDQAEDRFLEKIEDEGMEVYAWGDLKVFNVPEIKEEKII